MCKKNIIYLFQAFLNNRFLKGKIQNNLELLTEFSGLLGKHSKSPKKRLVYPNGIITTGLDIVLQYCLFDAIADESTYTVQVLRKFVQNLFGSVKTRNSIKQ